jgi:hypothetical protein
VAPSLGIELTPINVRDAGEIERALATSARSSNGGLIVTASAVAQRHRELIIALAARHKLPAVYFDGIAKDPSRGVLVVAHDPAYIALRRPSGSHRRWMHRPRRAPRCAARKRRRRLRNP